jgi:hypothetical protein
LNKIIAGLLGVHVNEEPPNLISLVPQRISNEIMSGQLPKFNPSTIMLGKNETCHFMDRAALVVKQKERSYASHRRGSSYKVTKNWTMHSTRGNVKPIEQEWYEFKEGVVFVTNERIIFVAPEHGFEKKIKNLSAVVPYNDAITLQFGSQMINIMMPQAQLMVKVLQMIH